MVLIFKNKKFTFTKKLPLRLMKKIHPVKMKTYSENGIKGLGIIGKKRTSKKAIEIPNGLYVRVIAQETNFEQRIHE